MSLNSVSSSDPRLASTIAENIERIRERIALAAEDAGQKQNVVTLCAVTKTRTVEEVLAAVAAGVADIGENYVQEARNKIPEVRSAVATLFPETSLTCHFIGHLQTNKIKYAVAFTDIFHSVDSEECLQEIAKRAQKLYNGASAAGQNVRPVARILIEVNLAGTPERAGVMPEAAVRFATMARETAGITLCGLMGMAPPVETPDAARPYFARLKTIFDALPEANRQILSMGMSGDFEAAIAEGATLVRIGTAIFGPRN